MNTPHRIWTTFAAGGEFAGAWRDLHGITRNAHGDLLFALDGGEVWQFTPSKPIEQTPKTSEVGLLGIGKDHATGKPCFVIAFLVLKNPKRDYTGNLRILPPAPPERDILPIRGGGDLKAAIAEMKEQMRREHGQHADTLGRVEANGADIVAEARRLKEGKRQAEANRMGEALGALEMLMAGLEPEQRNLFLALKNADGNRTAAAKELGISQETVSKRLPALRKAFEEQEKEIPHFLLPRKGGRKGTPPKVYRETYKGGDIEEERTPFDEVAEKEESERGAE